MISADRDYGSADIELDLAYDKANRVTSVAENAGTSYTIGNTYVVNTSNDYRDVSYPDGRGVRENHDLRGRVDTIVDRGAGGSGTPVTLADNAYDLNNRQTSRAFANGVTGTWTYDGAGRVESVEHVLAGPPPGGPRTIARLSYGRDAKVEVLVGRRPHLLPPGRLRKTKKTGSDEEMRWLSLDIASRTLQCGNPFPRPSPTSGCASSDGCRWG